MESTEVRISLAAAMALRFVPGRFWRDGRPGCLNLLLNYSEKCKANCAYCGLARQRTRADGEGSFIRVPWPAYPLSEILRRLGKYGDCFARICLSMVAHPRARRDTMALAPVIRKQTDLPLSLLASPAVLQKEDLPRLKDAGVERFTVAIDTATKKLFDKHRGAETRSPLRWSRYWQCLEWAAPVFGQGNIGAHWIVGFGEREDEIVRAFLRVRNLGGKNHLFSFFPEEGSKLSTLSPPPLRSYRRVQLARFLIDEDLVDDDAFSFNAKGKLVDFGLAPETLDRIVESGRPFFTSGCPGENGEVACNRPFGDSRPGPSLRNFPCALDHSDIGRVRRQMGPILSNGAQIEAKRRPRI